MPQKLMLPKDLVEKNARPFVVDWSLDDQVNLEAQMQSGAVVIHFDEKELRVLPHCTASSVRYTWVGVQTRERVVKIRNRAEFETNLPVSALKLSADFDAGAMLQARFRVVGRKQLEHAVLTASDLSGDGCDEATHVVTGVLIGAFHLQSGVWGEGGFEAGILRLSGGGRHEVDEKSGNVDACANANPDGEAAPQQCAAPVQILLQPLGKRQVVTTATTTDRPEETCSAGLKWDGNQCVDPKATTAAPAPAYECTPTNEAECRTQCDKGNLPSCMHLAGDREDQEALQLLTRVCEKGDVAAACSRLGDLHAKRGQWRDAAKRRGDACKMGDGEGCGSLAIQVMLGLGMKQSNDKAAEMLAQRGCVLGSPGACTTAGLTALYGVDGSPPKAEEVFRYLTSPCKNERDAQACLGLVVASDEYGIDGDVDIARALKVYAKLCETEGMPYACVRAGLIMEEQSEKAAGKAQSFYERGCGMSETYWCPTTDQLGISGAKHEGEGASRRACDGGTTTALACYNAAIASERGFGGEPDADRARGFLNKACEGGVKKACREPIAGKVRDL